MNRPPRDDPQVAWRVAVLLGNLDALPPGALPTPRTWTVRHDLFPPWEPPAEEPVAARSYGGAAVRKKKSESLAEGEKRSRTKAEHADYGVRKDTYLRQREQARAECAAAWAEGAETTVCAGCGDAIPSPHHYCGPCLVAQAVVRDGISPVDARGTEAPQAHEDRPQT